jgi:pimeloyl-ACP methyl ester carboxylesterase
MAEPAISSQFVAVGERNVFLRYAGSGPALLLLHQSPQNSRALVPWIERLAANYAVFAPDTPGFGYSDPLPLAEPEIPDFAAALAKLLDVLRIDCVLVYGVHTGAVTAMRLALDFPDRVAGLVCDGYARFDREEREDLLANYLPPFEPTWDGGHLTFMFQRMREQNFFFPWHGHRKAARLAYPIPRVAAVHSNLMDVLDAGDGYRAGYRAPFLYDDATAAARLKVPAQILYRAEDVLAPHMDRLPDLPANVSAARVEGGPAALVAIADDFFTQHRSRAFECNAFEAVSKSQSLSRTITASGLGIRVVAGKGRGTRIEINDIGHPARVSVMRDTKERSMAIDLPGHGASRDWPVENCGVESVAAAMFEAVTARIAGDCEIVAHGGSCAFAVALAGKLGGRCGQLVLHDPIICSATQRHAFLSSLPALVPSAEGGYLLAAWNWARTYAIFSAWETAKFAGNDVNEPIKTMAPAPRRVHAQVVEMLRAGPCFAALWKSALNADLPTMLKAATVPLEIVTRADSEAAARTALLAQELSMQAFDRAGDELAWRKAP